GWASPPFIHSPDWMRLPLSGYPDFATWQPFLDDIITHPAPDAFRAAHDRDPRLSRHDLVRHFPNQRIGGVQRRSVAHRQSEAVDRPERAPLRLPPQFL